jgi:enoyl-CoA hydratase
LNRPEKRNALSNELRSRIFEALHAADHDGNVSVSILRGAGSCFSLDGDGDQWVTSWEGVNSGGTWANVSGTGKFAGWQNSKGTWTYGARYGDGLRLTLWKGTCGE